MWYALNRIWEGYLIVCIWYRGEIIDVMEWMINTQLGRRNLLPAQRLAVMDKFKKKIQEQAEANIAIAWKDL